MTFSSSCRFASSIASWRRRERESDCHAEPRRGALLNDPCSGLPSDPRRRGFTLVELLAALSIIGLLIALLLPAVQMAREASRRTQCGNRLRQLGIAMQSYVDATGGTLPPSWVLDFDNGTNPIMLTWSGHGRLLPFLEQDALATAANYDRPPESWENSTAVSRPMAMFICSSDPNGTDGAYELFGARVWGSSFGWNVGDWYLTPGLGKFASRVKPRSPFYVNSSVALGHISDGLAKTIFAAEVRINQPYTSCQDSVQIDPGNIPPANADPDAVAPYKGACNSSPPDPDLPPTAPPVPEIGHAEWFDGRGIHAAFTTAWTPNKITVRFQEDVPVDIDLFGFFEYDAYRGPSLGAVTSRSYHPGGVHALMGDGGVRFVSDAIDGAIWRAAGTIAGGETEPAL